MLIENHKLCPKRWLNPRGVEPNQVKIETKLSQVFLEYILRGIILKVQHPFRVLRIKFPFNNKQLILMYLQKL